MSTDIVGIVRFSVVSTLEQPFLATEGQTFESKAEAMLNEERLSHRFKLFESITLASLDAQDDKDFRIHVAASTLLPQHWKERLEGLLRGRPYLDFGYYEDFRAAQTSKQIHRLLGRKTGAFFTFRLDDDDALACTFISRVRSYLTEALAGHALSLSRGYVLEISDRGYVLEETVVPNIAVGFGVFSSHQAPRTLFEITEHHHNATNWFPVITDATRPMFVAVSHGMNDTTNTRRERLAAGNQVMSAAEAANFLRGQGISVELEALELLRRGGTLPANLADIRPDPLPLLVQGRAKLRAPTREETRMEKRAFVREVPIIWRPRHRSAGRIWRLPRDLRRPSAARVRCSPSGARCRNALQQRRTGNCGRSGDWRSCGGSWRSGGRPTGRSMSALSVTGSGGGWGAEGFGPVKGHWRRV